MYRSKMSFGIIFENWETASALAEDIGEKPVTVRQWRNRDSIPGDKWPGILAAAQKRGYDISEKTFFQCLNGKG